jgi:hypothetical protein
MYPPKFMYPPKEAGLAAVEAAYRPRMTRFFDRRDPSKEAYLHLGWDEAPPSFSGRVVHRNDEAFSIVGARAAAAQLQSKR